MKHWGEKLCYGSALGILIAGVYPKIGPFFAANAVGMHANLLLYGTAFGPLFLALAFLFFIGGAVWIFRFPNKGVEYQQPQPVSKEVQTILDREANNPAFRSLSDPDYGRTFFTLFGRKIYV